LISIEGESAGLIEEVTPELRDRVREITENRDASRIGWLECRKADYLRFGNMPSWVLAGYMLDTLRTKDEDETLRHENVSRSVREQLGPVVEEAMEDFRRRRPDLDLESPENW
jgi:hypothetical protein